MAALLIQCVVPTCLSFVLFLFLFRKIFEQFCIFLKLISYTHAFVQDSNARSSSPSDRPSGNSEQQSIEISDYQSIHYYSEVYNLNDTRQKYTEGNPDRSESNSTYPKEDSPGNIPLTLYSCRTKKDTCPPKEKVITR